MYFLWNWSKFTYLTRLQRYIRPITELILTNLTIATLSKVLNRVTAHSWRTHCVRGRRLCIPPLKRICSHSHHSLLSECQSTRMGRTPCSLLQPSEACNAPLFLFEIQIQSWTSWSEQFPQLKPRGRSKEKLRQWWELASRNFPSFSSNQLLRLWVKLSRVHCPYQHFICWYRRQGTEGLSSSLCTLCPSRLNKSRD